MLGLALSVTIAALAGPPLGDPGPLVTVGPGATESSIRQVVRTPEGRVYIAAADDEGLNDGPAATLRMYRAGQAGVPTSFAEADVVGAPRVTGNATIGGGDARLDRSGRIHVVFLRTDFDAVIHQTFSTVTDAWGPRETVTTVPGASRSTFGDRGRVVVALALDHEGTPFVAVTEGGSARVYRRSAGGSWDGTTVGSGDQHPSLSFDRAGRLHAAWLDEPNTIRYARRDADGAWRATNAVVATGVLENGNRDQGPALAVDARNDPVVLYLTGTPGANDNYVRVRTGTGGAWVADDPQPSVFAHTPGIYLRDDDRFLLLGHDAYPVAEPAYLSRAAGTAAWSNLHKFAPGKDLDGSGSARFDPLYDTNCNVLDSVYFDEDAGSFKPIVYYAAIRLPQSDCGAPGAVPAPTSNAAAPRLSRVRLSKRRWRRGDRTARLRFNLSADARVTVAVGRPGRATRRLRVSAEKGRTVLRLGTRPTIRRLPLGRYRLKVRAKNRGGSVSTAKRLRFSVLKPRR